MNAAAGLRTLDPMVHGALTPVFLGLRTALHVLFTTLTVLVIARALLSPTGAPATVIGLSTLLLVTYALGGLLTRAAPSQTRLLVSAWIALVTVEWFVLLWLTDEAAYIAFPLFFLYLHLLGRRAGTSAVAITAIVAIAALGLHNGWSVGGVVGPLVGAGVAVVIGLGYEVLAQEATARDRLMAELVATRDQLVATEHESGVLAERSRLAREIHDTVAQGLSSIQMLLHAAERADPDRPGIEHVRLARNTAAANLADTRRFIRELTPPSLDDASLGAALRRLAETEWEPRGIRVEVHMAEETSLPMHLQTALLRIAQGALANVIQHADATTATIALTTDTTSLRFAISDNGRGFDAAAPVSSRPHGRTDSFGLQATKERVDQLGGKLTVESTPGKGTVLMVDLAHVEVP